MTKPCTFKPDHAMKNIKAVVQVGAEYCLRCLSDLQVAAASYRQLKSIVRRGMQKKNWKTCVPTNALWDIHAV